MNLKKFTMVLLWGGMGLLTVSCEKEITEVETTVQVSNQDARAARFNIGSLQLNDKAIEKLKTLCANPGLRQKLAVAKAVVPSECGPTDLDAVIVPYVQEFGDFEWEWYGLLSTINYLYTTYLDTSKQYFGVDGSSTQIMGKQKRNLETFWGMPNELTLKGEHNITLLNRDAIAAVYINFDGQTAADAYEIADYLIENVVKQSEVFLTSPLLSADGFADDIEQIIIGDGIIQLLVESGVDSKVAYSGVLAHEWAHQVQVNNYQDWYGMDLFEFYGTTPENTRLVELEADFLAGYYLTHKRGATYNWKTTAEFLNLFYNIGDCGFTLDSHHGTPNQRLAAARLGYIIAQETFPKGHILTANELHAIFLASYQDIIQNTISSAAALAQMKTAQLKAVYTSILKYEKELQNILEGRLTPDKVENLK